MAGRGPNQPRKESRVSQRRMVAEERRRRALQMKIEGHTLTEIAKEVGCDPSTLSRDMKIVLEEFKKERGDLMDELLDLELAKLDYAVRWTFTMLGKPGLIGSNEPIPDGVVIDPAVRDKLIGRWVQISDRRAELLQLKERKGEPADSVMARALLAVMRGQDPEDVDDKEVKQVLGEDE